MAYICKLTDIPRRSSFKFKVGIFALKAVHLLSVLIDYDRNGDSIITHVCELIFTWLFNHVVLFGNAHFLAYSIEPNHTVFQSNSIKLNAWI